MRPPDPGWVLNRLILAGIVALLGLLYIIFSGRWDEVFGDR